MFQKVLKNNYFIKYIPSYFNFCGNKVQVPFISHNKYIHISYISIIMNIKYNKLYYNTHLIKNK